MVNTSARLQAILLKTQPKRFSVIGTSGSGKTYVAAEITRRLGIKHVELDAIHWLPGWQELPHEEFRERIKEETDEDSWVVDGNYSKGRDIVWGRVEAVVWLDLPFRVVFWRILKRTVSRILTREKLWNNNFENVDALIGRYSMPYWVLKTYWKRKKEFSVLISNPEYSHIDFIQLKSDREVDVWLDTLV